jgi:hypothetical protein
MNTENLTPRKHKRDDENFKRSAVELVHEFLSEGFTRFFVKNKEN